METTATFRLFGDATLTAAAVTQRLGIQPTRAMEAGDRMSSRSAATRDSSAWLLSSSPGIETGTGLAGQLHRLPVLLEPVTAQLWDLVRVGYEANCFCYIASHAAELDRGSRLGCSWLQEVTFARCSGPFSGSMRSACWRIQSVHSRAACVSGASSSEARASISSGARAWPPRHRG